jgi:phage tail protein X
MQIARTQSEKTVADIAARIYNLKPGDAQLAAAEKALLAANPQLSNPAQLPAGTPVVVPAIAGTAAAASTVTNPQNAAWSGVLDTLLATAQQASTAQVTGAATTAPATPDAQRTAAITLLGTDIAQFKKLHTS